MRSQVRRLTSKMGNETTPVPVAKIELVVELCILDTYLTKHQTVLFSRRAYVSSISASSKDRTSFLIGTCSLNMSQRDLKDKSFECID